MEDRWSGSVEADEVVVDPIGEGPGSLADLVQNPRAIHCESRRVDEGIQLVEPYSSAFMDVIWEIASLAAILAGLGLVPRSTKQEP